MKLKCLLSIPSWYSISIFIPMAYGVKEKGAWTLLSISACVLRSMICFLPFIVSAWSRKICLQDKTCQRYARLSPPLLHPYLYKTFWKNWKLLDKPCIIGSFRKGLIQDNFQKIELVNKQAGDKLPFLCLNKFYFYFYFF